MQLALLTALAMVAFAANSLLNRAALAEGLIDPVAFGIVRLWAGAGMLGALVLVRRAGWNVFTAARGLGVVSLFTYIFGFSVAYVSLDAGFGALVLFGTVQVTMFAAGLVAPDGMPARRIVGALLAMLGLVWLLWPGSGATGQLSLLHAGLMMAAGVGWGIYSLIGRGAVDPLGDTAANFLGAGLLAIVLLPLLPVRIDAVQISAPGIWLAVISGAVTSGLGYALWYKVLPRLGAARGALAQLTVPVIAIAAGALVLGEGLSVALLGATALVLAGVAFGMSGPRK